MRNKNSISHVDFPPFSYPLLLTMDVEIEFMLKVIERFIETVNIIRFARPLTFFIIVSVYFRLECISCSRCSGENRSYGVRFAVK